MIRRVTRPTSQARGSRPRADAIGEKPLATHDVYGKQHALRATSETCPATYPMPDSTKLMRSPFHIPVFPLCMCHLHNCPSSWPSGAPSSVTPLAHGVVWLQWTYRVR